MKKRYLPMMLGLFGSLMLSSALFAGDMSRPDFATLDTNQDGSLSAVEAASDPELSKNWSDIDKDENGVIDQAEFSAFEELQGAGTSDQQMEQK
jgi:hypothetical protein